MQTTDAQKLTLNYREAAELLGVCENTLRSWVKAGLVPCCRLGRRVLFTRSALVTWLERESCRSLQECPQDGESIA